ncbi:MAG: HEAT repeat domain-containing protein [bacterium]
MILLLFTLSQDIDFEGLYNKATTLLVQFQTEQESAFARLVSLGQDSVYADTTIAFLVSNFDTKIARERHRMKDIFKEIGEPAIDNIVENIEYRGSDQEARSLKQTLWILGEIGSEKIVEPVARFIDDVDWQIRSSAYTALGKSKSRKALSFILKGLGDPVEVVRKSAYYALSQIATVDDLDHLLKGLDDDFYGVRYAAMQGLVNIGPEISAVLIVQVGKHDRRDYYILEILRQIEIPEQELFNLTELVRPQTRLLIYEMCQYDAVLSRFVENENNIFLRNYLLEKMK